MAAAALVAALVGCTPAAGLTGPAFDTTAPDGATLGDTGSAEVGVDDGYIPVGGSVSLTDQVPAVTNLDAELLNAVERASAAAADRGVAFTLTSGWRSERYQRQLFDDAIVKYGSEQEASRWVKPGDQSKHVAGEAVDIATADAMDWLNRFGASYGLCQVYANEAWHFELTASPAGVCPPQLTDSAAG